VPRDARLSGVIMRKLGLPLGILSVILASCGGGDSGNGSGATSYAFVPPALNSQRLYSETITDNDNSTIDISYTETVTAQNADGSYVVLQQNTSATPVLVDGVNWAVQNETVQDNSDGQVTSYSYVNGGGTTVTCTEIPHGAGPDYPLAVGMSWSLSYQFSCDNGTPVAYVQSGTVVDLESVTVPAGTFSALMLQSTLTWTDSQGTQRTQTITNWRDTSSSVSVKQSVTIAYAGTLPSSAYAVSREIELTSD
jgi:hypothetical protein